MCFSTSLDFKNADWNQFKQNIEQSLSQENININNFSSTQHIENALKTFNHVINTAKSAIPRKISSHHLLQISDNTKLCIQMRNKLKRQSQRTNNNNLKILLQAAVKQLNKLIDENVRKDRNENWNKFLSKLPIGSKRFWCITKALRGKKSNSISTLKCNDQNFETINELELEQITNIDTVNLITLEEVRLQIKKLKNNKAPGFDGILNIFLKKLPDIALEFLRNILNA